MLFIFIGNLMENNNIKYNGIYHLKNFQEPDNDSGNSHEQSSCTAG